MLASLRLAQRLLLTFSVFLGCLSQQLSASDQGLYIPAVLEDWKAWVLHDHPELDCPHNATGKRRTSCAWLTSLDIEVNRDGPAGTARFEIKATVFAESEITLPYAKDIRAHNVTVNGDAYVVTGGTSELKVLLAPGEQAVTGTLSWTEEPTFLTLPKGIGTVSLTIDGNPVNFPRYEPPRLWFSPQEQATESEEVDVKVFRRLVDSVPQMLHTNVQITASGSDRIVPLGRVLPPEFEFTHLNSPIPAQVDESGDLTVQVTRGKHNLWVRARATDDLLEYRNTKSSDRWPDQEIWGIDARTEQRTLSVTGVPSVDLALTSAPFQDVPAFIVDTEALLRLEEQQRTNLSQSKGSFRIQRHLWLGFDGKNLVAQDQLVANLEREQRVSTHYSPGMIADAQGPRLITFFGNEGDQQPGVNITKGRHVLTATSLLPRDEPLHATGWNVDAENLEAGLYLPPGWRLLWTRGVDYARDSWIEQWDLWDIFLVLLLLAIAFRTSSWWWIVLIGITAVISYQDSLLPTVGWLLLAAIRGVQDQLGESSVNTQSALRATYWVVFSAVAVVSVYFSITHVRQAVYPQLEQVSIPAPMAMLVDRTMQSREGLEEVTVSGNFRQADSETSRDRRRDADEAFPGGDMARTIDQEPPSQDLSAYQGDSIRQTGPGTPTWQWRQAQLTWYGPVQHDQQVRLTLMPPWLSRIMDALAGVLVLLIGLYFIARTQILNVPFMRHFQRFLPVLLLFLLVPDIHADTPDLEILDELESRLTAEPSCLPNCASLEQIHIELQGDLLTLEARVHSLDHFAVPLPTLSINPSDLTIALNAKPVAISRDARGSLLVLVPPGISSVLLRSNLATINTFEIELPLVPAVISVNNHGWQVGGITNGVLTGSSVQLNRIAAVDDSGPSELVQYRATPYVSVERHIVFDLETRIRTHVRRLAPNEGAFSVSIPLLENEEVIETSDSVQEGRIILNFDRTERSARWISRLDQTSEMTLTSPDLKTHVEVWKITGSDHLHWDHSGLDPVLSTSESTEFLPRSGDTLNIQLRKPQPVPGESSTIETVHASYSVGTRLLQGNLVLTVNATRGSELEVLLPEGSRVIEILKAGTAVPPPSDNVVTLPISPGNLSYQVEWQMPRDVAIWFSSPRVSLQLPARNIDIDVAFQGNRWPIFLAGPVMGPAVLFWGVVVVILLIALALSFLPNFPLTHTDAVILSLGATMSNVWVLLLLAVWFVAIWIRGRRDWSGMSSIYFQVLQISLSILSVLAVLALIATIPRALLGNPDMQIVGNNSTASFFTWYADQVFGNLPTVTVVSLPNWIYLLLMLAWSLWLAFAIVKWSIATWKILRTPAELADTVSEPPVPSKD